MVTDSYHWLKAVGLFLSNFAGFSIFNLDVRIWASLAGCPAVTLGRPVNVGVTVISN